MFVSILVLVFLQLCLFIARSIFFGFYEEELFDRKSKGNFNENFVATRHLVFQADFKSPRMHVFTEVGKQSFIPKHFNRDYMRKLAQLDKSIRDELSKKHGETNKRMSPKQAIRVV